MKLRLSRWLAAALRRLNPRNPIPVLIAENRALTQALSARQNLESTMSDDARRFLAEIAEAQQMCGAGPWRPGDLGGGDTPVLRLPVKLAESLGLKEAGPVGDVSPLGAYGMYELLLQNVGWQREINYSWLEFSRWGIQQIILICRLYYLKNPICRRLVDVIAQYTFARGFDVTTDDPAANDLIKDFIRRNQKALGHVALTAQQRSKLTDGNLFWAFFTDPGNGECDLRIIDATEIQDIWTDPEDADVPQYYLRQWTQRTHDAASGTQATVSQQAWYPAVDFDPQDRPATIKGYPVMWDSPVYHRKIGTVGKWLFGCPLLYPVLDWAKEARRRLEACASQAQSLAQFSLDVTTKGGQQAIEGWKQQLQTQVGPGFPLPDSNPPAIAGSAVIHGPGTTVAAFDGAKAELDPERVRRYLLMCCMALGMPETFLGDVSTGNLATATSLDRPTETVFLSIQEEWVEDITVIVAQMLKRSLKASAGKLREACAGVRVKILEGVREIDPVTGRYRYAGRPGAVRSLREAKAADKPLEIEIRVQFPAIREGDMATLIAAGVQSLTLGNRSGQIVGADEKAGILWIMTQLGLPKAEELIDDMYPDSGKDKYDPDRTKEVIPPPIKKPAPFAGGVQPAPADVAATGASQHEDQNMQAPVVKEMRAAMSRLTEALAERLEE